MKTSQKTAFQVLLGSALLLLLVGCEPPEAVAPASEPEALILDRTLEEVIAANHEAMGAEDLLAVQSLRLRGKVDGTATSNATLMIEKKRPDRFRREMLMAGMSQPLTETIDGGTAWQIDPIGPEGDGVRVIPEAEALRFRRWADIEGVLIDSEAKGHRIELKAKVELDGQQLYQLKVTHADGMVGDFYLDATTFLLARNRTISVLGGQQYEAWATFGDYREINGAMWAHEETTRLPELGFVQTVVWEEIEVDPEIDDSRFAMPAAS